MRTAKEQITQLLAQLPDSATLTDIRYELSEAMYALNVKQHIERGMQASREGRITPHDEVKKRFLDRAR